VGNLQASLELVLKSKIADTMAVQKYDIPKNDGTGEFEERFWCSVNSPILGKDGQVSFIVHNAQDVTSFIKSPSPTQDSDTESLQQHADHLEHKMYHNAQALQVANKELRIANEAKSTFLASMSHELRTPLSAIIGFSQVLNIDLESSLDESQKECIDYIERGGKHLLELINSILDLTKIESGKTELHIEDIAIRDVVDECISLIMASVDDKQRVNIFDESRLTDMDFVRADHTRVKQVLFNLLSNAVKYNSGDCTVTLNSKVIDNQYLRISITDDGPGIAEHKHHELFEPFKRLGAETTSIEGSGIGLSIAKKMMGLMAGEIGFKSQVGAGSTFWVDFPLTAEIITEEKMDTDEDDEEIVLPAIKGTMLYVEDNRANTSLMKMIVSRVPGLTLITAPDAELGLAIAQEQKPDIIILDIHLPGMDGYQALKVLKSLDETSHIPVLALSAAASEKDKIAGLTAGFDRYLSKPIDVIELTLAIKNIVSRDRVNSEY